MALISYNPLSKTPLVLPATMLCAGITVSYYIPLWPVMLAIAGILLSIFLKRSYMMALSGIFLAGTLLGQYAIPHRPDHSYTGIHAGFNGRIVSCRESNSGQNAILEIKSCTDSTGKFVACRSFKVSAYLPGFKPELTEEAEIRFAGTLTDITADKDMPDDFNYGEYLIGKNIFYRTFIAPDSIISLSPGHGIMASAHTAGNNLTTLIYRTPLSPRTKEFLATALTGSSQAISQDVREAFNSAGIAHILALSGLHAGLIAWLLTVALWPLTISGMRTTSAAITMAALWVFAFVTGASPSVVRAVIMASVSIIGRILERPSNPINSLALAAILILTVWPEAIFEAGFQMSFSAVLAIILFGENLNPVSRKHRVLHNIAGLLCVSISAMLGTGIIAMLYFHSFPAYFLLTNIAVSLLLPPLLAGGVLLMFLQSIGFAPDWLCTVIDALYSATEHMAVWVASLPGAKMSGLYMHAWLLIPYIIILILIHRMLTAKRLKRELIDMTAVSLFVIFIFSAGLSPREPRLYILRNTAQTDFIADTGSGPLLYMTTSSDPGDALAYTRRRIADYMGLRGIDSIASMRDNPVNGIISADVFTIVTPAATIAILHSNEEPADRYKADFVVICRGCRMPLNEIDEYFGSEAMIVLSADLGKRWEKIYIRQCREEGRSYMLLREQPMTFPLRSGSATDCNL